MPALGSIDDASLSPIEYILDTGALFVLSCLLWWAGVWSAFLFDLRRGG